MTNEAFSTGMVTLGIAFPAGRDEAAVMVGERSRVYRDHLHDLTDGQWQHAVSVAVKTERWFPTVAALREYASEYRPAKLLPAPKREPLTPEERAAAEAYLATLGMGPAR